MSPDDSVLLHVLHADVADPIPPVKGNKEAR